MTARIRSLKNRVWFWIYDRLHWRLQNAALFIIGDWWMSPFGKWLCERGGHKPGVWWFNPGGTEPDMRCKRCDTDLG